MRQTYAPCLASRSQPQCCAKCTTSDMPKELLEGGAAGWQLPPYCDAGSHLKTQMTCLCWPQAQGYKITHLLGESIGAGQLWWSHHPKISWQSMQVVAPLQIPRTSKRFFAGVSRGRPRRCSDSAFVSCDVWPEVHWIGWSQTCQNSFSGYSGHSIASEHLFTFNLVFSYFPGEHLVQLGRAQGSFYTYHRHRMTKEFHRYNKSAYGFSDGYGHTGLRADAVEHLGHDVPCYCNESPWALAGGWSKEQWGPCIPDKSKRFGEAQPVQKEARKSCTCTFLGRFPSYLPFFQVIFCHLVPKSRSCKISLLTIISLQRPRKEQAKNSGDLFKGMMGMGHPALMGSRANRHGPSIIRYMLTSNPMKLYTNSMNSPCPR